MKIIEQPSNEMKILLSAIKNLENKELRVGWFEKSKYENGMPVAQVAVSNEYGNPKKNVPARPFMRPAVAQNETDWKKTTQDGAKKVLSKEFTINQVLDLLGFQVEGDIKKAIKSVYSPALAEKTILARIARNKKLSGIKGRIEEPDLGNITKPLIDTKVMFNTVTHEII